MKCILCGRETEKLYNGEVCEFCIKEYNLSAEDLAGDVPSGYVQKEDEREKKEIPESIKKVAKNFALVMLMFNLLTTFLTIISRESFEPYSTIGMLIGSFVGALVWYFLICYIVQWININKK